MRSQDHTELKALPMVSSGHIREAGEDCAWSGWRSWGRGPREGWEQEEEETTTSPWLWRQDSATLPRLPLCKVPQEHEAQGLSSSEVDRGERRNSQLVKVQRVECATPNGTSLTHPPPRLRDHHGREDRDKLCLLAVTGQIHSNIHMMKFFFKAVNLHKIYVPI